MASRALGQADRAGDRGRPQEQDVNIWACPAEVRGHAPGKPGVRREPAGEHYREALGVAEPFFHGIDEALESLAGVLQDDLDSRVWRAEHRWRESSPASRAGVFVEAVSQFEDVRDAGGLKESGCQRAERPAPVGALEQLAHRLAHGPVAAGLVAEQVPPTASRDRRAPVGRQRGRTRTAHKSRPALQTCSRQHEVNVSQDQDLLSYGAQARLKELDRTRQRARYARASDVEGFPRPEGELAEQVVK